MQFDSWLMKTSRFVRWHRRSLAALCVVFGILAGLVAFSSQLSVGQPVVVTSHEIEAGEIVTAADLEVRELPESAIPKDAIRELSAAEGARVLIQRSAGSILTSQDLHTGSLISTTGGEVLAPMQVNAVVLSILRVGDSLAVVVANAEGRPTIIAESVRVAAIPPAQSGGLASTSGGQILIATSMKIAQQIASTSDGTLSVVLLGEGQPTDP